MREQNDWRIITDSIIDIDLSTCKYPRDIHCTLREAFGFPVDYGANWSAFWDYLDDFCGDIESSITINVCGLNSIGHDLKDYTKKMVEIMHRAEQMYPKVHFVIKQ
jgi:Barstar, RNAse (barnase) inhibitor